MKIVIRVDSSRLIGSGHLVRCQTLAEVLRKRGAEVQFICRDHLGNLVSRLTRSSFKVKLLPSPPTATELREDYALWLGVPPEVDAMETWQALAGEQPDWLIVDHYGLDQTWEQQLRPHVKHICVIDDLANRPHDSDILLDQNENHHRDQRYQGLIPNHCRPLLGCHYALLRPEYAQQRQTLAPHPGKIERIFLFFGGTDPHNLTGLAIAALSSPEFQPLTLDVVIGATNPHRPSLETQAHQRGNVNLHGPRPHLADLMATAHLAIGAGGTTTYERMCLGLPSLVISIANNQRPACDYLAQQNAIFYLGSQETVTPTHLQQAIGKCLNSPKHCQQMAEQGQKLVDGKGVERVVAEMLNLEPCPPNQHR